MLLLPVFQLKFNGNVKSRDHQSKDKSSRGGHECVHQINVSSAHGYWVLPLKAEEISTLACCIASPIKMILLGIINVCTEHLVIHQIVTNKLTSWWPDKRRSYWAKLLKTWRNLTICEEFILKETSLVQMLLKGVEGVASVLLISLSWTISGCFSGLLTLLATIVLYPHSTGMWADFWTPNYWPLPHECFSSSPLFSNLIHSVLFIFTAAFSFLALQCIWFLLCFSHSDNSFSSPAPHLAPSIPLPLIFISCLKGSFNSFPADWLILSYPFTLNDSLFSGLHQSHSQRHFHRWMVLHSHVQSFC